MSFLMCKECLNVYKSEYIKGKSCPIPNCEDDLFEIDEEMIPIIIQLRSKGYDTLFCCQGHLTGSTNQVYIMLDESPFKNGFTDITGKFLVNLPEGFEIRLSSSLIYNESTEVYEKIETTMIENIELEKKSVDEEDYYKDMQYLNKMRENLLEWSLELKDKEHLI